VDKVSERTRTFGKDIKSLDKRLKKGRQTLRESQLKSEHLNAAIRAARQINDGKKY
jgi:hypothetical protein